MIRNETLKKEQISNLKRINKNQKINNKRIIKMRKPNRPDENKYKDMALIDIEKLWKEEYIFEEK